jgi:type IV pilus assembly protein PilQ
VLIEARIVEANKTFARDLGVRLGVGGAFGPIVGYTEDGAPVRRTTVGGALGSTRTMAGQVAGVPTTEANPAGLNLNLPAGASNPGLLSMVLWNNSATRFLNLELSALDVDGRGRLVSSPRVLTANQVEALIEQGTEIPYEEATSSGSTSVTFKKAVLSLKVKPQITPDGRLQLTIEVNKDSRGEDTRSGPAIDTKKVKSEVLIENGGTVVIGGIYEENETNSTQQVPLLGDIPVLGHLFKSNSRISERRELLVFITPRIVSDALTLR